VDEKLGVESHSRRMDKYTMTKKPDVFGTFLLIYLVAFILLASKKERNDH